MVFTEIENKKPLPDYWYLVKCPTFCESGFQIATWDSSDNEWLNDSYEYITEYVVGYFNYRLQT